MDSFQTPPDDRILTQDGLAPKGAGRILILACGALAREIIAVLRANNLTHIDLQCLPAIYHNHPEKIVPAIEKTVAEVSENYETIFVAYADCGTGGQLQAAAERLGVHMMAGPHCYAFFEDTEEFVKRSEDEFTSFYLTDFLVRQFDAFVWRPLGLDRHPELRDMYFGHYEKLIYQAQIDDPKLTEAAKEQADRLGLEFERRFTGYGDLGKRIIELGDISDANP
ncbi:MAG: DUF1638 domain-containing protein [Boseongicola sp.]|nr:MAG: DUF1638 domain-containing protein [Boseongicola sp.]